MSEQSQIQQKRILFLNESICYDRPIIDTLHDANMDVEVFNTPDYALKNIDKLETYDCIATTMFLGTGTILDMRRCNYGTKTGIAFLYEIRDKVKTPKLILRVESMFEIDNSEYEWCKKNNVTVVNESYSRYDEICRIITNTQSNPK